MLLPKILGGPIQLTLLAVKASKLWALLSPENKDKGSNNSQNSMPTWKEDFQKADNHLLAKKRRRKRQRILVLHRQIWNQETCKILITHQKASYIVIWMHKKMQIFKFKNQIRFNKRAKSQRCRKLFQTIEKVVTCRQSKIDLKFNNQFKDYFPIST